MDNAAVMCVHGGQCFGIAEHTDFLGGIKSLLTQTFIMCIVAAFFIAFETVSALSSAAIPAVTVSPATGTAIILIEALMASAVGFA